MKKVMLVVPILALAIGGGSACATKKFVRTEVGGVNDKVETLSKSVEENQERTRQNEGRIGEVDAKADAASRSAQEARSAADAADQKAGDAGMKFDAMDKASRRLIYEVVLTEDQANFKFGQAKLADEAKVEIDSVIQQLKADPKGYYLEIEGHTDSVGSQEYNNRLGLERAEAVKRYLYEQHQVPLHKINVISFGEEKPAASDNRTRANRALNRRVVIKVLA